MSASEKISFFKTRPHPGPLPQGEGESFAVSRHIVILRLLDAHSQKCTRSHAVPSPGGEGQGEGGRYPILFRDSKTKFETSHVVSYE